MASKKVLPRGWTIVRVDDLGAITTGKTPSTRIDGHFGGLIPFITPSDMDGRKRISSTDRCLTEKGAASVGSARIPAGAILVSCIGSDMGKTAVAGHDAVTNQQINSIVVHPNITSDFVYYNLSSRKSEFQHLASGGSAQPILNKTQFSRLPIVLPPRSEQKAIAHMSARLGPVVPSLSKWAIDRPAAPSATRVTMTESALRCGSIAAHRQTQIAWQRRQR